MKSDQAAKRPVPAGVVCMNKRRSNRRHKVPNAPDLAKIVQLEGQFLKEAMHANAFEHSVALPNRENMDLVTFSAEVIRPANGMGNGQIGQQADSPWCH